MWAWKKCWPILNQPCWFFFVDVVQRADSVRSWRWSWLRQFVGLKKTTLKSFVASVGLSQVLFINNILTRWFIQSSPHITVVSCSVLHSWILCFFHFFQWINSSRLCGSAAENANALKNLRLAPDIETPMFVANVSRQRLELWYYLNKIIEILLLPLHNFRTLCALYYCGFKLKENQKEYIGHENPCSLTRLNTEDTLILSLPCEDDTYSHSARCSNLALVLAFSIRCVQMTVISEPFVRRAHCIREAWWILRARCMQRALDSSSG